MKSPSTETSVKSSVWSWPIDVRQYDCTPDLSAEERQAMLSLVGPTAGKACGWWRNREIQVALRRLLQPLFDVFAVCHLSKENYWLPIRTLFHDALLRDRTYWAWSVEEWLETIAPDATAFRARAGRIDGRHALVYVAYLLGGLPHLSLFPPHSLHQYCTAAHVFGKAALEEAASQVFAVVQQWGYGASQHFNLRSILARVFLATRSPLLEDITFEILKAQYDSLQSFRMSDNLILLSRALVELGILSESLPRGPQALPLRLRVDTTGVSPEWAQWCFAWHERSPLPLTRRDKYVYTLLQVGRWLKQEHPHVTSPAHWDYDLAATFVAALDRAKIGSWGSPSAQAHHHGKPLAPSTKFQFLSVLRRFFTDLQEVPYAPDPNSPATLLPRRFNPARALATPRSIRNRIGPDPRVIDYVSWWKIRQAAETLREEEIPRHPSSEAFTYPPEMVRAIAALWCYGGLRSDEIVRLPVGCIRWQWEDGMRAETEEVPEDATCFLYVPVNKTETAFWKPVYGLVGKRLAAWEQARPPQPRLLDAKTGHLVDYLFSYRGLPLSRGYLNTTLIPLLCAQAGVPRKDTRGTITSHRARATIATVLYNASDELTIEDMQYLLGHKSPNTTRSYIQVQPTRLARKVAHANKNARLVEGLFDPAAAVNGEPAMFYYLGDGSYCGNPLWVTCPHRLACLKCDAYLPPEVGRLIEAREGVARFSMEVPLSSEEREAVDGDVEKLNELIARKQHLPPPPVPDERYMFNPRSKTAHRGKPLNVIQRGKAT